MIAQRFQPVVWVVGVAAAATMLYMVSLQVAAERGRLEEVDRKIADARHEIRQLQTEMGTRANLRQLERWNGEVLALSAPKVDQYLRNESALAGFDQGVVRGQTDAPAVMFADAAAKVRGVEAVQAEVIVARRVTGAAPAPAPSIKIAKVEPAALLTRRDRQVQQAITASASKPKVEKVAALDRSILDRGTLAELTRAATHEAKGVKARP